MLTSRRLKPKRRILFGLLILLFGTALLLSDQIAICSYAAQNVETVDTFAGRTGSVSIVYAADNDVLPGARFQLYQAGFFSNTVSERDPPSNEAELKIASLITDLDFSLKTTDQGTWIAGNGLTETADFEQLIINAYDNASPGHIYEVQTDPNGRGIIQDVASGLYLVKEIGHVQGYVASRSFLITIPATVQGQVEWHVQAEPKPNPFGALTIRKSVTGSTGEQSRDFHFTVSIDIDAEVEADADFTYQKSDGSSGTWIDGEVFALKSGESIVLSGIPVSAAYRVVEQEANTDGYTTSVSGSEGTILEAEMAEAAFVNHRGQDESKTTQGTGSSGVQSVKTGDHTPLGTLLVLLLISLLMIILVLCRRVKRTTD